MKLKAIGGFEKELSVYQKIKREAERFNKLSKRISVVVSTRIKYKYEKK